MTNKKNKLITFFVSLIPGAGEMYLGFYKTGISIMALFWGDIALFGSLIPPMLYLLPVLWFYSFFHTHNLNHMPDEEFYALEDDYLFHMSAHDMRSFTMQYRKPLALLLILIGLNMIWDHLSSSFWRLSQWLGISSVLFSILHDWIQAIPQLAAAFLIIWAGWKLIQDKKDSLDAAPRLKDSLRETMYQENPHQKEQDRTQKEEDSREADISRESA